MVVSHALIGVQDVHARIDAGTMTAGFGNKSFDVVWVQMRKPEEVHTEIKVNGIFASFDHAVPVTYKTIGDAMTLDGNQNSIYFIRDYDITVVLEDLITKELINIKSVSLTLKPICCPDAGQYMGRFVAALIRDLPIKSQNGGAFALVNNGYSAIRVF